MQKSGFFNALNAGGQYDRKYNANDYSDNLAVVISNGVLRSIADDLKVTASGMICTVAAGRAWINGHYYYNDSPLTLAAVTAPIGGSRWDRVMLRLDTSVSTRSIAIRYVQGTAGNTPTKPAPVRTGDIYELVLADVFVNTNATSVVVTDTRADTSVCGWLYSTSGDDSFFTTLDNDFNEWFAGVRDELSSVTLFKRYTWRTVLQQATSTIAFNIPQYDADTCFLEVYINGILETENVEYTVNNSILTFVGTLIAGTEAIIKVYKSIDGTGIESVADEITQLQNQVAAIESAAAYNYNCINSNDNISLSQIAQAIYAGSYVSANVTPQAAAFLEACGGNTWLAALPSDAQVTINVIGKCGCSTTFAGSGTALDRYKWFSLGIDAAGTKRVIFDFAKCERLLIWCATNTENIIFYGTDQYIKNVTCQVRCNAVGCSVEMIAGRYNYGNIIIEDCKLLINTTAKAVIAENGTFINCYCLCSTANTHALCFVPTTESLIRLIGGTYLAYTASTAEGNVSAIFYTYSTEANAVIMAYNINCPVIPVANFYQKKLSVAYNGKTYINGVVTTLESEGAYNEIVGRVNKSKRN